MFENLLEKIPVILVVESRDDVYARLQEMLAEEGVAVERARCAASVPSRINRLQPDLILIHAELPYESGWLIACKLTFSHPGQNVWLYGAQDTERIGLRQHVCGVGAYVAYGGVLPRLIEQVQQSVRRWWRADTLRSASPVRSAQRLRRQAAAFDRMSCGS